MKILKVISMLMTYPEQSVRDHSHELIGLIAADANLPAETKQSLQALVDNIVSLPLLDAQERYTGLFDRGRALSLLLFEHVHGESRDRGQAMVDLMGVYQKNGFEIDVRELPDYIPLFLEYLSQQDEASAREWLGEVAHILGRLSARLSHRDSPYHALFDALLDLATNKVDMDEIKAQVAKEKRDDSPEALDKIWEEEAITFGGNGVSGGCPTGNRPSQGQSVDAPDRPQQVKWVDAAASAQASGL